MVLLAIKNLWEERGRLFISAGGVAAALVLVLLLDGVFTGVSEQIVAYPEQTDAQVWVMQEGVSNMHMSTSILPRRLEAEIRAVEGVEDVTPVLYVNNLVETGQGRWFSYIVGVEAEARRGGPWAMAEGAASPGLGEAIIPDVLARKGGVGLGESVTIMGREFRVVGLSRGTFSMANSMTFLSYKDLEGLLSAPGAASYFLVKARPEVPPSVLAERVSQAVPGAHSMTREDFIASDRSMSRQMGVDVIQVMTVIGFVIGMLVVGLTIYTATVRRSREYGIVKALGARNGQLMALVAVQALVIAALGLGVAVAVAYLARPAVQAAVPEIAVVYSAGSLAKVLMVSGAIAPLASLLPAYRITRIEPGAVFKE